MQARSDYLDLSLFDGSRENVKTGQEFMFVLQALRSVSQQITAIFSLFNLYSILRSAER